MLIKIFGKELEFEFNVTSLPEVLSAIRFRFGEETEKEILGFPHKFILINSKKEEMLALESEIIDIDFSPFDTLLICPEVSGDIPVVAVAALLAVSETSWVAIGATALINIGLSVALSVVMNLISRTTTSNPDSKLQKSDLFGSTPILNEQGCVVPIWMGESFAGGVLIYSGLKNWTSQ